MSVKSFTSTLIYTQLGPSSFGTLRRQGLNPIKPVSNPDQPDGRSPAHTNSHHL